VLLFIVNVFLIILFAAVFNKSDINESAKIILDVIVCIFVSLIIIIDVFSKINFCEKLKYFIRKNIDIFAYIIFCVIDIYGICFALYTKNLSASKEYEFLSVVMSAIILSFVFIFLIILVKDIKFNGRKIAKFYLNENDVKYYIYYAKGKFLMCGTDINSDKAEKYKLIKLDEINNYEIFRESERINEKAQIELNEYGILDKLKYFLFSIKNKNKL